MRSITKKMLAAGLLAALILGLAACQNNAKANPESNASANTENPVTDHTENTTAKDTENTENTASENTENEGAGGFMMIANPFTDCNTLEEAEKAAGFAITIPKAAEATETVYRAISGEMIEVIYYKGNDELLRIRKNIGTDPVDGDYNVYEKESDIEYANGKEGLSRIHEKINGTKIFTATWTLPEDGKDYSYAVSSEAGLDEEALFTIIEEMTGTDSLETTLELMPGTIGETGTGTIAGEDGRNYSARTVLITTDGKFSEEELSALLEKYSLSLVYDYDSFNIYALASNHDMNSKELNSLLDALRSEDKIIDAEPDEQITLTDPVEPPTVSY